MTNIGLTKLEKNKTEAKIVIENSIIKEEYEKVLKKAVEDFEAPGFRKGKAPRDLVEKNLNRSKIAMAIVQNLLPKAYEELLKEHNLRPVVDPKVFIDSPKNIEDILASSNLEIRIVVAEAPMVKLETYKKSISEMSAKDKIWTPGKDEKPEREETKEEKDQKKFVAIIDLLLKTCKVELSDLIIETETNRLLSQTLEEVKKLGLSLDDYLKNTGKTSETLKKESEEKAKSNLELSFIFDQIAKDEKITVEQKDLEAVFDQIKDEKQKTEAKANSYRIAPILLRQKVIDFLLKL